MNTSSTIPVLSIIFGPVAAVLVAIVFANVGIAAKAKRTSYLLARVEVIEKILANVTATDAQSKALVSACQRDLLDIMIVLRATSIRAEELARLEFDKRPWFRRLFPPRSASVSGVMAVVIYYVYLAQTIAWIGATIVLFWHPFDNLHPVQGIFMIMNQGVGVALGYWWALKSARSAAIISQAKRLVAFYGLSDPLLTETSQEDV